jgi:hypothetical protein
LNVGQDGGRDTVGAIGFAECCQDDGGGDALMRGHRESSITLRPDEVHAITIRDQLPLKFVDECLQDGVTRQDFLDALNGRAFFWLSRQRLQRLLNARAYRSRPHLIMHIDTAALLDVYGSQAELARYKTGSAHVPNAPKRGPRASRDHQASAQVRTGFGPIFEPRAHYVPNARSERITAGLHGCDDGARLYQTVIAGDVVRRRLPD